MRQARSQVGSRLAVASSAKISRPRPPECVCGAFFSFSKNCSTSAERASVGSRFLLSLIAPLTPAEPHRGIAEDGAAARQTGIGARRQVDPNTLLEGMIGPQSF